MTKQRAQEIRGDLLKRGESYSTIACRLGLSRQHVRAVVIGRDPSSRVWAEIVRVLGFDPRQTESAA